MTQQSGLASPSRFPVRTRVRCWLVSGARLKDQQVWERQLIVGQHASTKIAPTYQNQRESNLRVWSAPTCLRKHQKRLQQRAGSLSL